MAAKYYDLTGQAALDSAPDALGKITEVLKDQGIDTERFKVAGLEMDFYSGAFHYRPLCFDTRTNSIVKLSLPANITDQNFDYIADWFSAFVIDSQYKIEDIREVPEIELCDNSYRISRYDFDNIMGSDLGNLLSQIALQNDIIDLIKDPKTCVYLKDAEGIRDSHLLVWNPNTENVDAIQIKEPISLRDQRVQDSQ